MQNPVMARFQENDPYGHWLDLFITRSNCKNVKAVSSSNGLSDHLTVLIDLWLHIKSSPENANIIFRPINKIDLSWILFTWTSQILIF